MPAKTARNVHDPRVRELVRATGSPDLFGELAIPRSTSAGWLRGAFKSAVGTEAVSTTEIELHRRLAKLERRTQVLLAVLRLLLALAGVSGCHLTGERLRAGIDMLSVGADARLAPTAHGHGIQGHAPDDEAHATGSGRGAHRRSPRREAARPEGESSLR